MHCVLVADDSRPFAEMLRATLEDAGFEVVTAYSGLAAVAALEHNNVDVAVLDVLMPGISGDAVAHRLQQLDPRLRVLLMTGADGASPLHDASPGWRGARGRLPARELARGRALDGADALHRHERVVLARRQARPSGLRRLRPRPPRRSRRLRARDRGRPPPAGAARRAGAARLREDERRRRHPHS